MAKMTVGTSIGNARSGDSARAPRPVAPALLRAPGLLAAPQVGVAVALDAGGWSGTPAPRLAFQWLRDGVEIPGAAASHHSPGPGDALRQLSCRVLAKNAAGSAEAVTPARVVLEAAPRTVGGIPDLYLIQNSGVHNVNAFSTFTGSGLSFSVTGEGVTIDPETGVLSIATGTLQGGIDVTVTASNSGGSAQQVFRVRIAAEALPLPETEPEPAPVAAPVARGGLSDIGVEAGSGPQIVDAAPDFEGEALSFAVEGAGAAVDAATGRVSIPAEVPLEGGLVTVTASNAGGTASSSFRVTVTAVVPEPEPEPEPTPEPGPREIAALSPAEWEVEAVRDPLLEGAPLVGMIRILAGPAFEARHVYRTSLKDTTNYYPGYGFEICIPHPDVEAFPNCWLFRSNNPAKSFHIYNEGEKPRTVVRWSPDATGPKEALFSPDSDVKTWLVEAPEPAPDDGTGGGTPEAVLIAPALIASPALVGEAKIGREIRVVPGEWSGTPAPDLVLQWQCDGADIAGATAAVYVPRAGDDGRALACAVTATSPAGSAQAVTASLRVTYEAPVAAGGLSDEVFDEDSGPQVVETAADFRGEALSFAVAGAGATIDAAIGQVTIPTEVPLSGEVVTVTAANSGGEASSAFQVTVEAQVPETPEITGLEPAQWQVEAVRDPILPGAPLVGMIRILEGPALQARQVYRTAFLDTSAYYPGYGFEVSIPHPDVEAFPNCWLFRSNNPEKSYHIFQPDEKVRTTLRWSPEDLAPEEALFSPDSDVKEWRVVAPSPAPESEGEPQTSGPPDLSLYRLAPYVTEAEFKTEGYIAGDTGQYMLDAAQSMSNPDLIITGQDMGCIWASLDHGNSWYNLKNRGLLAQFTAGLAIDPVNPKRWFAMMGAGAWGNYAKDFQGLYATQDGGLNWTLVIKRSQLPNRMPASTICAAPSSATATQAKRWYAIFSQWGSETAEGRQTDGDDGFFMSDGGGDKGSWSKVRGYPYATFGHPFGAAVHPTKENVVYVWGTQGLIRFNNASSATGSYDKLSGKNGLPGGTISGGRSFYISSDGQTILLGVSDKGVYRSTNGGGSFTQIFADGKLGKWHVNPWNPDRQMITYGKGEAQGRWSRDGGKTFTTIARVARAPGEGDGNDMIDQGSAHIFWHRDMPERVWAHGRPQHNQSDDGGKTWRTANAGFSGKQHTNFNADQMFDPKNADRFGYPLVDFGYAETRNRGRWFVPAEIERGPLGIHGTVNGCAIHPDAAKGHVLICMDRSPGGKLLFSKDGVNFVVADAATEKRWYIGYDYDNPRYAFQWRQKSSDHGETWSFMPGLPKEFSVWGMTRFAPGMKNGQAIFAIDVNDTLKVVRRSLDRGASWPVVLQLERSNTNGYGKGGAFRVHPSDPDTVFTRTGKGHILRKWSLASGTPGNRPYKDLNIMGAYGGTPPDGLFDIESFTIDPRRPEVMYVMNGYINTPYKFFRTSDSGGTWDNLTEGFPGMQHAGMEVSPVTGEVYISGGNGMRVLKPPYAVSGTLWDLNLWGNRYLDKPY